MNGLGSRIQNKSWAAAYLTALILIGIPTSSFASTSQDLPADPESATITIPATVIPAPPSPTALPTAIGASTGSIGRDPVMPKKSKNYRPKIFNPQEFATLKVLTETILRDDEMPGVREARANEFIDFQIAYDPEIQDRFHEGLAWLDQHSKKLYGRKFTALKAEQRRDMIQCLEIKAKHRPGEEIGRDFFELAKRYTYMGFYASEEALRIAIPVQKKQPRPKRRQLAGTTEEKVTEEKPVPPKEKPVQN